MIILSLNDIKKYYGATMVIDNVSFEIHEGEKVGIVGKNGCGKSTILKLIMGIEGEYTGSISTRKNCKLGYVDQIPHYKKNFKVIDVLNTAFELQHRVLKDMQELEKNMPNLSGKELDKTLKNYALLQQNYECIGGYEIDELLSKICTGLNFTEDFKQRDFNSLSGGEKTSVLLAKVLLQKPDILLLDEPSNHLDLKSIEWLEDFLKSYNGAALVVSHDRYFLDKVVTKIVEIEEMKSTTYLGNYSEYTKQKETFLKLQFEAFNIQQKTIKSMENTIKNLRDWGSRGDNEKFFKRAESMQKRLDNIDKIHKPKTETENMNLNITIKDRSGKDIFKLIDGYKSFDTKIILKNANLHLRYGEKVALIGNNGCGKSTLLKLLLNINNYELDSGNIESGSSLKIGYLPQDVTFKNEETTILDCFREDITITEGKAREYLSKFLFFGETVFKKVKNISGGERSRLMLSKLLFNEINMLILDEPTNHLDIASRESLESTLNDFNGTILFVSHDRYFINLLSNRVIELKNGTLTSFDGNYEYYKLKVNESAKNINVITKKFNNKPKQLKTANKRNSKNKEKSNQRKLGLVEDKISDLEEQIKSIENEMSNCNDHVKLNELYNSKEKFNSELECLIDDWVQLS